jgi:hypothetical protein
MAKPLTQVAIQDWLRYWDNGKQVNLGAIRAFEHVYEARRYCQCMVTGVFHDVTDLEIWRALSAMRAAA